MHRRAVGQTLTCLVLGLLGVAGVGCTSQPGTTTVDSFQTPPPSSQPAPEEGRPLTFEEMSWDGAAPIPVEDIASFLEDSDVAVVMVASSDGPWPAGYTVTLHRTYTTGSDMREDVSTFIRSADGDVVVSIATGVPQPACGQTVEYLTEVRGMPGCVVQSGEGEAVTMLKWEEANTGFRIESDETVESLIDLVDEGLTVVIVK